MLKPYVILQETCTEITYEFKPVYLWILYGIILSGCMGFLLKITAIYTAAGIGLLVYFLTISLQYRKLASTVKKAALTGVVRYSGSKWSFSKPLRITITKNPKIRSS